MHIHLKFSPRFERKAELFDNSTLPRLQKKLDWLNKINIDQLVQQSHMLRNPSSEGTLWVAKLFDDYRVIFRRIDKDAIELLDIVAHDDLYKFVREGK
jgi:mRNA-degrading endonuclease RelE of RelBE toxin-antitoxin system